MPVLQSGISFCCTLPLLSSSCSLFFLPVAGFLLFIRSKWASSERIKRSKGDSKSDDRGRAHVSGGLCANQSVRKNEKEKWFILKWHANTSAEVDMLMKGGWKDLKTWADMTWRNDIIATPWRKGERIGVKIAPAQEWMLHSQDVTKMNLVLIFQYRWLL